MQFFTQFFKQSLKQYLMVVIVCLSAPAMAGEQIDKTLSSEGVNHINIENLSGETTIIGWSDSTVTVKGELDKKAEGLIFEKKGSTIKIKVVMPRNYNQGWNSKGSVLAINLPKDIRINFSGVSSDVVAKQLLADSEIKTVSGEIEASDLTGNIELNSVSGSISTKNLKGKIRLSSVSGDINDKNSSGRLLLKAVSGEIATVSSANEIYVNNVSGDIKLKLQQIDELEISTVSGDLETQLSLNKTGGMKVSSVSGDMNIRFQKEVEASFRLNANAGGDLHNKITKDKAKEAKYGPSSHLDFQTGNGAASFKASTISGSIRLSTD